MSTIKAGQSKSLGHFDHYCSLESTAYASIVQSIDYAAELSSAVGPQLRNYIIHDLVKVLSGCV